MATSALGITALTLGLAAPAVALPPPEPLQPQNPEQLITQTLRPEALELLQRAQDGGLARAATTPGPRLRAADAEVETSKSVLVTAEEVARTEKSATFRFTLPDGEVTRDDAVLQSFVAWSGYRISTLSYLTDPTVGMGADPDAAYSDQIVQVQLADLVRENFSVTGATPHGRGFDDHFSVPAGQSTFEITVSSRRTGSELAEAIQELDPGTSAEDAALIRDLLFGTRLALPENHEDHNWTYGDKLFVMKGGTGATPYPNGANELHVSTVGNLFQSTSTVTRIDGLGFSGDRLLHVASQESLLSASPLLASIRDLMMEAFPPPLRSGTRTTQVTGATHVRDGFYLPTAGAETITWREVGTGPSSPEEARSKFSSWVTNTCDADLNDQIPPSALPPETEAITWQELVDQFLSGMEDADTEQQPAAVIYTGAEYVDAATDQFQAMFELIQQVFGGGVDDLDEALETLRAALPDWDAACGTTGDPGDGEGPAEPQVPAVVTVNAPDGAVAGEPITLSATVLDADGNPVVGEEVTFHIDQQDPQTGTLQAAARALAPAADRPTVILTATTDADGVATVQFTPTSTGTLRVSASTSGPDPVSSVRETVVPVTPPSGGGPGDGGNGGDDDGGDDDDGDDDSADQSGFGSLGSLFGSLGS